MTDAAKPQDADAEGKEEESKKVPGKAQPAARIQLAAAADDDGGPPEDAPPAGAPLWITTFADLMSLLMCFFVMLVAASELEKTTFKEMIESMKRGFGGGTAEEIENFKIEDILSEADILKAAGMQRTRENAASLRELLKEQISDGRIEVEEGDQQITIQILSAGSFSSGSANLKKAFKPVATKIKSSLGKIKGNITVAGHTDNIPMKSKMIRSNWELSSARAFSVMHALMQGKVLDPKRFVLRGYAETRPRVPNTSESGRSKNRRVEIVIDQRDAPIIEGDGKKAEVVLINHLNVDNFEKEQDVAGLEKELGVTPTTAPAAPAEAPAGAEPQAPKK